MPGIEDLIRRQQEIIEWVGWAVMLIHPTDDPDTVMPYAYTASLTARQTGTGAAVIATLTLDGRIALPEVRRKYPGASTTAAPATYRPGLSSLEGAGIVCCVVVSQRQATDLSCGWRETPDA
ncbi:hypothetical protein OHA72_10300 [Dactylosporangium sp. NBC_01737]|uniref:hypothetical protein n=1 Tax=Dactylosporangium sp. NBC_01737 TaxID=2975959 RepID=UPI002E13ED7B|nr:hypothetical protein OHA72_10300 [Dactylosporangium sp. NBC_01737]